ncbi:VOC family protein [Nocardioides sp. YIM 152315]|uniref:VOC family protein n=1 Tax=Nocardioides sp. YIM 152315 TaxID=3031760 RepID=UPI0023DC433E|nr:VOC family protein [Nocardioides sp. YIM 152315]MDF1604654.1 VOC family protein [Nocardioides sp. YIM 152315]
MTLVRGVLDVGIVVSDLDHALAIYRDALELPVAARMDVPGVGELVALEAGRSRLRLVRLTDPPPHQVVPGGVRGGASGIRYVGLEVTDLAARHAACTRAGATTVMPPTTIGPTLVCTLADPDGTCIELMERLP